MKQTFTWKGLSFQYDTATAVITLNAGSVINATVNATFTKTASSALQSLRKMNVDGVGTVLVDTSFKSLSSCASFIVGGSKSGNEYFKGCPELSDVVGTTTPESSVSTPDTTTETEQEGQEKKTSDNVISDAEKGNIYKQVNTFFVDVAQEISPRMLNTLGNIATKKARREYIRDYMLLCGKPQDIVKDALAKMKSPEWDELETKVLNAVNKNKINNRLIIKFGSAGTGKTTSAIKELISSGLDESQVVKVVANGSQADDELFVAFDPDSKSYKLTAIGQAMQNGTPIIIDEANLYNIPCLTRLQGVLDNTKYINDRFNIEIKDGFKVIITMNLETNFGKTPLPSPLVDRATKIENYDEKDDILQCYW